MEYLDRKKIIIISIAGLFFLYLLFSWTMSAVVHSRPEVMVPDIQGKSLNDAISVISALNLGLKKDGEEFNQSVPAGTVIRQNPLPGMTVREGKIIRITMSRGGEVVFVPDLIDQPVRTAEITIRTSGFNLGEESTKYSVVTQKGYVISQDPAPGTITDRDSIINLVISAGLPADGTILMPQWAGRNVEDVRKWAEQNRFRVEVYEENDESVAAGTVLRQVPPPDTELSQQENIILFIAGTGSTPKAKEIIGGKRFYYEIPQGGENRQVRLTLLDKNGEREIFRGIRAPGSKLDIPIDSKGSARVRVFINNILIEERELR